MKFKTLSGLFLLAFLIFTSCMDFNRNNQNATSQYPIPNMDSLITSQISRLANKEVSKKAILDTQGELINIKTDTAFWRAELDVFLNLEINKPSLVGAYKQNKLDGNTLLFKRKKGEKNGVLQVAVRRNAAGSLMSIKGSISDNNFLYASKQVLELNFEEQSQLISHYYFSGYQKLIARDTVFFEINGKVKL